MSDCPYYDRDYKRCKFFDTLQDQSQRDHYCLTSDNWRHCANYENRSYEEKANKKIRSNPDL